jgi:outer membrane assembly lipoprotein YfiO
MVKVDMKITTLLLMFVLLVGCSGPSADFDVVSDTDNATGVRAPLPKELIQAERLLAQNQAKKAYKLVKKWIKANKDSSVGDAAMEEALWLKGQSLFIRKLYYQAFLAYDELLDNYPASEHYENGLRRQVEIASLFLDGAKRKVWGFIPASARTEAIAILEKVPQRWPNSELTAQAIIMQADYFFYRARYLEAQPTYQIIIDNYRGSDLYEQALLGSAESTYAQYPGSSYDTSCLDEAIIRYNQYRGAFPKQAAENGIAQRMETIRQRQVQKEIDVADFYLRTGKTDAARQTWSKICQKWPNSDGAVQARELLQKFQL